MIQRASLASLPPSLLWWISPDTSLKIWRNSSTSWLPSSQVVEWCGRRLAKLWVCQISWSEAEKAKVCWKIGRNWVSLDGKFSSTWMDPLHKEGLWMELQVFLDENLPKVWLEHYWPQRCDVVTPSPFTSREFSDFERSEGCELLKSWDVTAVPISKALGIWLFGF